MRYLVLLAFACVLFVGCGDYPQNQSYVQPIQHQVDAYGNPVGTRYDVYGNPVNPYNNQYHQPVQTVVRHVDPQPTRVVVINRTAPQPRVYNQSAPAQRITPNLSKPSFNSSPKPLNLVRTTPAQPKSFTSPKPLKLVKTTPSSTKKR